MSWWKAKRLVVILCWLGCLTYVEERYGSLVALPFFVLYLVDLIVFDVEGRRGR